MHDFSSSQKQRPRAKKAPKFDLSKTRLIDDRFFRICFANNLEACQVLVDRILGIPGLKVTSAKAQESVAVPGAKSVILDLSAKTATGERIDIEVQRSKDPFQPRRARYYLSVLTMRMLGKSRRYKELKDAYVLFICEHDPFNEGKPLYSFVMRTKDNESPMYLNDGSCICFFNCDYKGDDAFGKLASDMMSEEWGDIHDPTLQSASKKGKLEVEKNQMSYSAEENFDKGYRKGVKTGVAKGIAKGRRLTLEDNIAALLRDGRNSPEQIAEILRVPLEVVLRIKDKIRA